jgi:hypothetical protein
MRRPPSRLAAPQLVVARTDRNGRRRATNCAPVPLHVASKDPTKSKKGQIMPSTNPFALPQIPSLKAQGLDRGVRCAMYLLAATSLRDFLQPMGITGYKAGLSGRRHFDERIADIRLRKYASIVASLQNRNQAIRVHPLAREWFLSRLPNPEHDAEAIELMRQVPEGRYADGKIEFRLPPGQNIADVEKNFQRLLEPRNLNTFLASNDGKERLKKIGLPPDTRLFTDYNDMGKVRRSLACELFLVRPQRELPVLLRALLLALEM